MAATNTGPVPDPVPMFPRLDKLIDVERKPLWHNIVLLCTAALILATVILILKNEDICSHKGLSCATAAMSVYLATNMSFIESFVKPPIVGATQEWNQLTASTPLGKKLVSLLSFLSQFALIFSAIYVASYVWEDKKEDDEEIDKKKRDWTWALAGSAIAYFLVRIYMLFKLSKTKK
jgi:hypothetical protein